MEIQQHDGVVVEVAGSRQGFAKLLREGEVLQGEREAPGAVLLLPSLPPTIYRPPGGAPALEIPSTRGAAAKGEACPQVCWEAPPALRVSNPRRIGPLGAHQPTRGLVPSHIQPIKSFGAGGPTRWTPGHLSVVPVQYR